MSEARQVASCADSTRDVFWNTLARCTIAHLGCYFQAEVTGRLAEKRECTFGEFADSRPMQTCVGHLRSDSPPIYSLVEIGPSLAHAILDRMLGGDGSTAASEHEMTEVERHLMASVFRVIAQDLSENWRPLAPASFAVETVDVDPRTCSAISRFDPVTVAEVEVNIGVAAGTLIFVVPSAAVAADSRAAATENGILGRLTRELFIDASCELRGPTMPLRYVGDLRPGDTIDLAIAVDTAAVLAFNGVPKFQARIVAAKPRTEVRIEGRVNPSMC